MGEPHLVDGTNHPCGDATIGLAPTRAQGVHEIPEVAYLEKHAPVCRLALQVAFGLDDVVTDPHLQPPRGGDGGCRLLCPDERACVDGGQGMGREVLPEGGRPPPSALREREPVQQPVPDVAGVLDLGG